MATLTDDILTKAKILEKLHDSGYLNNRLYYFHYNGFICYVEFPISHIKGYRIINQELFPYFEFKYKNVFKPINHNSTSIDDREYVTFIDLICGDSD